MPIMRPEDLTPDDLERLATETWSYSRFSSWLRCPLQYFWRYVAKLNKPKGSALSYGIAVHAGMEMLAKANADEREAFADEVLRKTILDKWAEFEDDLYVKPGEDIDYAKEASINLVLFARDNWDTLGEEGVPELREGGIEKKAISTLPSGTEVIGFLDAMGTDDDVVIDWKTAGAPWQKNREHGELQASVYSWLLNRDLVFAWLIMNKPKKPKNDFSKSGKEAKRARGRVYAEDYEWRHSKRTIQDRFEAVRTMEMILKALRAGSFFPNTGSCGFCDYTSECSEYRRSPIIGKPVPLNAFGLDDQEG